MSYIEDAWCLKVNLISRNHAKIMKHIKGMYLDLYSGGRDLFLTNMFCYYDW